MVSLLASTVSLTIHLVPIVLTAGSKFLTLFLLYSFLFFLCLPCVLAIA